VDDPAEARLDDPELLHERGRLVGLQLAELHLDLRREGLDERVLVAIAGADPLDQRGSGRDVALADVQEDEDGLLGQEPEAADRLGLVDVEAQVPDRPAGLEALLEAAEDDLLALVGSRSAGVPCRPETPGARRGSRPWRGQPG
jgi:hypothetical protein